ncbi:MAG: exo-alpha-sialidase [Armatimonadetes bacterium]|nr:exo-alpha-sialidase [Armatimonadota bacterium]
MSTRGILVLAVFSVSLAAQAQWDDVKRLGNGGETYVSTDGKGTVWVSSHLPTQALVSRDFGATFEKPKVFGDALGDMVVYARPNGKAVVTYMYNFNVAGMSTWKVSDYGKTWEQGKGIPGRPLDREWPATDEKTGDVFMIYSDGYIGGPKSKGVFLAKSTDEGLTWKETGRIDKEAEGDYPVDPHLVSSGGKLYALWTTSKDYNTIDAYKFASSGDGGKTWENFATVAAVDKIEGADVQERWMLGGLAATGEKEVVAFYMNYRSVTVFGNQMPCLLVHTKASHDGGKTWGEPVLAVSEGELKKSAGAFVTNRISNENFGQYMQCLSWGAFDAKGRLHMVWADNREGQEKIGESAFGKWRVRHAVAGKPGGPFGGSEAVSKAFTCKRPPLDFICCAADDKYVYVTWTETPGSTGGMEFSGEFWFGRRKQDE